MGVEAVKTTIGAGIEASKEAASAIASVRDKLRSTRSLAAVTTHGSTHETVTRGLHTIDEADQETELTLRRLHASASAAERYLGSVG